jgi:dihydrodipicolinate synthase/N-acetylneuraminate lyase
MLQPSDVRGLMAMMPAFATDEANQVLSVNTVAVDRLESGLDQMIRDGADVIATTGSFGEFHTLLPDEFETLATAAVETTRRRLPIFIGTTALNSREVVAKMKVVDRLGADGVIVGVPFYFPSSPANVVNFYKSIAELFPRLAIMAYHNPELHNVRFNIPLIEELLKIKGMIAMKDNARMPQEFVRLASVTKGRMSLFVNQGQYRAYAPMGAAGFWSIDAWMGPEPQLALRDAVSAQDWELADQITLDITRSADRDLSWRETAAKIGIRYAGYVDPGPLRPPFVEVPENVDREQRAKAEHWKELRRRYGARQQRAAAS